MLYSHYEQIWTILPDSQGVEILGDRWTLLIVRNMLFGAHYFNELERGLPGISKAILAERLKRLQQVGVLERQTGLKGGKKGYQLTEAGRELAPVVESLTRWGARWAFGEPDPEELNPVLLLWWMRDRVHIDRLPGRKVVVEFNFRMVRPSCYWLVLSPVDVSVCLTHPGYEIDLFITTDLAAFYQVWMGRLSFSEALHRQLIELEGDPELIHSFPDWFALSPAAGIVREVVAKETLV